MTRGGTIEGETEGVAVMAVERAPGTGLRWAAFGLMGLFGFFGSAFMIGGAMEDPGGARGVLLISLWLVPMLIACVVCAAWPRIGSWVAAAAVALLAGTWIWFAVDPEWWRSFMDDRGPVIAIATFAVGLPLAFLGLRAPGRAGWMLLATGLIPIVGLLLGTWSARAVESGLPPRSAMVIALPFVVSGVLFLAAERRRGRAGVTAAANPGVPAGSAR
jgi:hypothetical protein